MKKNVKNKIFAFSMAVAVIASNVAVSFAEAPKAGLATVAKEASKTKTIYVSYIEGAEWKESEQVEVPVDATAINTGLLKNVPAGYETCEQGDLPLNGSDCINISIRKKTTKTIYVSYIDEETKQPFADGIEEVEVAADATIFSTSALKKVPEGYEVCETGDRYVGESDTINIEVRKKAAEKKIIYVSYIDEETKQPFENGIEEVEVAADATIFNTSALKNVPEGYEVCETGDRYVGENDTINIEVRKKAAEKKIIYVSYIDEETKQPFENGIEEVEVAADATIFNTSALKNVPEGYEVCETGDRYVGENDTINIEVRKKAAEKKIIYVSYIDEETKQPFENGIEEVEVAADATIFNTSALKNVPEGYELCETGDHYVGENDSINIEVRKKATQTRTVYVHYIDTETKIPFENAIEKIEIPADEIHVNTNDLKEIPVGYETVVTGDLDFYNTDDVNVELRKIEKVTTLHVNFETVDGTLVGEKTFEKTSTDEEDVVFALGDDIVLPEGYHWVNYNDQIKNVTLPAGATGGHYMFVEQDETQAVLTVTFETKDGETVGTTSVAKEFTVDENGDKVTTFVLGKDFTLPEDYHLADGVDQVTEITMAGTVGGHTVIVEKDAVTPPEDPKTEDPKKDDTKKEETKKPSKTPDTADTSDVAAYAIPLVMSMVAISAIVVGRKKLS